MAAQELELKVDSAKYQARITQLEGYVRELEILIDEYNTMKDRVKEFIDADSDGYEEMRQNVEVRINRVRNAITATNSQIQVLKDTLSNMNELGTNIGTILQKGLEEAAAALFV